MPLQKTSLDASVATVKQQPLDRFTDLAGEFSIKSLTSRLVFRIDVAVTSETRRNLETICREATHRQASAEECERINELIQATVELPRRWIIEPASKVTIQCRVHDRPPAAWCASSL